MPTITPTRRPGVHAALDRSLARAFDQLSRSKVTPLLTVLLTAAIGVIGASARVHLSA
jgi:hypothetical protein